MTGAQQVGASKNCFSCVTAETSVARETSATAEKMETPCSEPTLTGKHSFDDEQQGDDRVGVLLLNLGGPERLEDVEPFLYNLFADPDIIRLPKSISWLQRPLATLVSRLRAPKSREAYASIGNGSPLTNWTQAQANGIDSAISKRLQAAPDELGRLLGSVPVKTYIAMRYWHPFTEEALEQIAADGISKLVILPLYPQYSMSTTSSSLRALQKRFISQAKGRNTQSMQHTVVPHWYQRPGYIEAMRRIVTAEVEQYTQEQRKEGVHVLFSAHGVPKSYVEAGDPYQAQIEHCVKMITKRLPEDVEAHLSYQSRVGPVEWLRPATDEKLQELGLSGVRNLVVVPISFVSEHVETLEELDIEYREVADEAGITGWRRAPALNTDKAFIDDLAAAIIEALQNPVITVNDVLTNDLSAMKPSGELNNHAPLQQQAEANSNKVQPRRMLQEGSFNRMTSASPAVGSTRKTSISSRRSLPSALPDSRESAVSIYRGSRDTKGVSKTKD
jgi:ferrochelatase